MAYTNSSLATVKILSPNHSGLRNHAIDTITIHCVVGQCTARSLGQLFANPERKASSNYGIGHDGTIGLYVEEKNRSWCSGGYDKNGNPIRVNGISGSDNDHRAITIEVASDTFHPYAVTDKAYDALIDLLTDICERNNIKELKWKGDKSLVGKVGQQNMTVHRWFANKACPGDFLYGKHTEIANKVNERLKSKKLTTGAEIVNALVNNHGIVIHEREAAIRAINGAKDNGNFNSLYWILYKVVNGNE